VAPLEEGAGLGHAQQQVGAAGGAAQGHRRVGPGTAIVRLSRALSWRIELDTGRHRPCPDRYVVS
jgi:hypothetical protein